MNKTLNALVVSATAALVAACGGGGTDEASGQVASAQGTLGVRAKAEAVPAYVLPAGISFAGPVSGQGTWETTLQARDLNGDGVVDAYYDTDLNITWLAQVGTFVGTWPDSVNWASNLNVYGVSGWRLPTLTNISDTCDGPIVVDPSEWRHMFFVTLGNGKSCFASSDPALKNTGPFSGFEPVVYWSGTENANVTTAALDFFTYFGVGSSHDKLENRLSTWAVHDGDVGRKYTFSGFLPPINLPPTVNTGKAGRSFPLKWTLADAQGATVSDLGAVKSITYKESLCSPFTTDPTGASAASPPGHSQLSYDQSAQQYQFNWKSPSTPGCYVLFLTLNSGQFFGANVMLRQ